MSSVYRQPSRMQPKFPRYTWSVLSVLMVAFGSISWAQSERSVLPVENAEAKAESEMKEYTELIEHTDATIEMVPIEGGTFLMGSPEGEEFREPWEGPQHQVKVNPFWMGKYEITWDAFEVWVYDLDIQRQQINNIDETPRDEAAAEYQISQPTEPYSDMTSGMGKENRPAVNMTQFAARTFCQWLTMKTGRYYRLPTEAEWEYACRAGTTTAYSFGDDPADLDEYAWYYDNSDESYHEIGLKKPNPWGLHDMHGNVAEWVLDEFRPDFYSQFGGEVADNPLAWPTKEYPRVVRGGSWDGFPEDLRSAARAYSDPSWKDQDPQIPKSIWYHTDALHVGFRIVRPLVEPSEQEKLEKWDKQLPEIDRKQGR
ncbi:MAG: formylglycine-generating enzyme family protein [Pirellulaceae bacterium]